LDLDRIGAIGPRGQGVHRLVRMGYQVRSAAFAYLFLVIGVYLWERYAGLTALVLLILQFVIYPQVVYAVARRARRQKKAELNAQYLDALLFGVWTAALGYPTWIAYATCAGTALNAAVAQGLPRVAYTLVVYGIGMLIWIVFGAHTYTYWSATSTLVTSMCFFGSMAYAIAIGCVVQDLNRKLQAVTRDRGQAGPP
jgi:diguanylate cyclase